MSEKQSYKDQIKEITAGIEKGIQELFESDRYRNYLTTMSRFHRYSVNNVMLIHAQRPDATLVAGYNRWKNSFERHVKKGERGIRILAPTPYKIKKEQEKLDPDTNLPMIDSEGNPITEEKEITIPMYKIVRVFDVSQTDGKPLPQLSFDLTGDVAQYEVFLEALRRTSTVPIGINPMESGMDGYFSLTEQAIFIREGMSQVQTVSAIVHEMAHSRLHNYEKIPELADDGETVLAPVEKDRNTEEVEAESVSYAVCQYFGIETKDNSFGYIASWSQGKELKELRASLETINKTSSELITSIESHFQEICKERGIDLTAQEVAAPDLPEPSVVLKTPDPISAYAKDFAEYIIDRSKGMRIPGIPVRDAAGIAAWAEEKLQNTDYRPLSNALLDVVAISGQDARFDDLSDRLASMNLYGISVEDDVLSTKRPEYKLVSNFHRMGPGEDTYIQKYLHGENSKLIPAEIVYLGTYEECLEIQSKLRDGTMTEAQVKSMGDSEKLYLISGKTYLHIQRTDDGFDYTLYDKETSKLLDGGQINDPEQHIYSICLTVCDQHGLDGYKVSYAPLALAESLREAQYKPSQQELRDRLADHFSQQDAAMWEAEPEQSIDAPLPDPTISWQQMEHFGYADSDMLPLSKDRAAELMERDITVYMLYRGGTDAMAFDTEDIVNHDGLFGITRDEWQRVKDSVPARNVEQRFKENPQDAYVIFQLKQDAPQKLHFAPLGMVGTPQRDNYNAIYTGALFSGTDTAAMLENLYTTFNTQHPADFSGHSLSMGDIVAIKQGDRVSFHYCDTVGFKELPGFGENYLRSAELSTEDDYGMIDGIINNGKQSTVAELEQQAKSGQPISLMDLADAVHREKKPSVLEKLKTQPQQPHRKSTPKKSKEREI